MSPPEIQSIKGRLHRSKPELAQSRLLKHLPASPKKQAKQKVRTLPTQIPIHVNHQPRPATAVISTIHHNLGKCQFHPCLYSIYYFYQHMSYCKNTFRTYVFMPHSGLDHCNIKEMQLHLHAFDTITNLLIYAFRNLFWIKKNIFQYPFIGRQNQNQCNIYFCS